MSPVLEFFPGLRIHPCITDPGGPADTGITIVRKLFTGQPASPVSVQVALVTDNGEAVTANRQTD